MPDWVREHVGEIALLIYILYPLFKRWGERRKERRETKKGRKQEPAQARTEAQTRARKQTPTPAPTPSRAPAPTPTRRPPEAERPKPTRDDFLEAARRRVARIKAETLRLLARAQGDPRLARLVPALQHDLLGRIEAIERSLGGTPTVSTIVQDTTVLRGLEELLRYLSTMARQRTMGRASFLADADAMADACYAPIREFARGQGLKLRTSQPVAITGDWGLSIVPRFASTRVAPLRLPPGFEHDVARWPAIAHEVAHDLYYSLDGLEEGLRTRLDVPEQVAVLVSERELDANWLRQLFGPWLAETFADTLGTIMLGPAYVEAMRRTFANPASPQRTAAIFQDGGVIDEHPPARLRLYMATRVLRHLGRHEEADALWKRWESEHPEVSFYFLPLGGDWVGLSAESLHGVADAVIDMLLERPWPELDRFQLLSIPGLPYLHADHATVERLIGPLSRAEVVEEDPRWIMAAAVLAATAEPALHDEILDAARRSIRGVGEPAETKPAPSAERRPARGVAPTLIASTQKPAALVEAIALGATLGQDRFPKTRCSR